MRILSEERAVLGRYMPGLDEKLAAIPLMELEAPENPGVSLFKECGGAGLLIPEDHGGSGASALHAVQLTRAIAARAPSLAIGTTMHQFSVASLVALAAASTGTEWMLLNGVATDKRLMSSGFAEGRAGAGILTPTMKGVWDGTNWRISGKKQPCSLSRSMDLLTASVLLDHPEKGARAGIALIPAASPGISISPFWRSLVLTGAESDSVVLEDVEVHPELIVELDASLDGQLDDLQTLGFVWFELLVAACYLGMTTALVERLVAEERGPASERAWLAMSVESAAMLLDGAARRLDDGDGGNDALARSLVVRFSVADTIRNVVGKSVELLGGMAFVGAPDVPYLAAAANAIGFHPPSRTSTTDAMLDWFAGRPVIIE